MKNSKEECLNALRDCVEDLLKLNFISQAEADKTLEIADDLSTKVNSSDFGKILTDYICEHDCTKIGGMLGAVFVNEVSPDGGYLVHEMYMRNLAYLPAGNVLNLLDGFSQRENAIDFQDTFDDIAREFASCVEFKDTEEALQIYEDMLALYKPVEYECEFGYSPIFREWHVDALLERMTASMTETQFLDFENKLLEIAENADRKDIEEYLNGDSAFADRVYNLMENPIEKVQMLYDYCIQGRKDFPSTQVQEVLCDVINNSGSYVLEMYCDIIEDYPEIKTQDDRRQNMALLTGITEAFKTNEANLEVADFIKERLNFNKYYRLYSNREDSLFYEKMGEFEEELIQEKGLEEAFKILDIQYKVIPPCYPRYFWGVYDVITKYNKNINLDNFCDFLKENDVIADHIIVGSFEIYDKAREFGLSVEKVLESELKTFRNIYSKTRTKEMIPQEAVTSVSFKSENFDLGMWREITALPQFQGKVGNFLAIKLLNLIGGFENDPNRQKRVSTLVNYFKNREYVITEKELKGLEIAVPAEFIFLNHRDFIVWGTRPRMENVQEFKEKYLTETTKTMYKVREGVRIPPEFEIYFTKTKAGYKNINQKQYSSLMRESGNSGKRLLTFLSPYKFENGEYVLRNNVQLPEALDKLKPTLTEDEYEALLYNPEYASYVNPLEKIELNAYKLKPSVPKEAEELFIGAVMDCPINSEFTQWNTVRKLSQTITSYEPGFAEFLLDNLELFFSSSEYIQNIDLLQRGYESAVESSKTNGKSKLTLNSLLANVKQKQFISSFGAGEFAKEAFKAGVNSQQAYEFYEEVYKKQQQRTQSTIPELKKVYTFDLSGEKVQYEVEILPLTDVRNVLIGERNYVDSCQKFGLPGQRCLEHASKNHNGRMMIISKIGADNSRTLLGESWVWTNENKLTFDNFEATLGYVKTPSKIKTETDKHICEIFERIAKLLAKNSEKEIKKYVKKRKLAIDNSRLTERQKRYELSALASLQTRQAISLVTIGDCYDSIDIGGKFERLGSAFIGPKGYNGYTDVNKNNVSRERLILNTQKGEFKPEESYTELPIYRDKRQVNTYSNDAVTDDVIVKIQEIEKSAVNGEVIYSGADSLEEIKRKLNTTSADFSVTMGCDWFIIKTTAPGKVIIQDVCIIPKNDPGEKSAQKQEIITALKEEVKNASGKKIIVKPTNNALINQALRKFSKSGALNKISQKEFMSK